MVCFVVSVMALVMDWIGLVKWNGITGIRIRGRTSQDQEQNYVRIAIRHVPGLENAAVGACFPPIDGGLDKDHYQGLGLVKI